MKREIELIIFDWKQSIKKNVMAEFKQSLEKNHSDLTEAKREELEFVLLFALSNSMYAEA